VVKIATNYPTSSDSFDVPSSPSTTPLSSAGTGSRNHTTHHRDLGDAVVAIQNNVTKTTHLHDGTGLNGPKLSQVNTHQSPDTDASAVALHHTIGTGAFQAAAGNHLHTGVYTRIASNETITGKHTFPSGTNAIAIPDFQNSQHNHSTTAKGGPAAANGAVRAATYYSAGPPGYANSVPGNVTTDFLISGNRFTIPANQAVVGWVSVSYIIGYNTGGPGTGDQNHSAFLYVTHNITGDPLLYTQSKNIVLNGANFNGNMVQVGHLFDSVGAQNKRQSLMIPIYMAATGSDRPNVGFVMRVLNSTATYMSEFNWGININLISQSFISI
jgi:hypothetical protein